MHIFVDTSILYNDPFWKDTFSRQLLKVAGDKRINIYLCSIVLEELKHHFEKNLTEDIQIIKKTNRKFEKNLRKFKNFDLPEIEQCINDFEEFYSELVKYNNFKILEPKNEYLPKIIKKAIKRKKPFTEKKTELKDALIWLTYSDYANSNNLSNCIFITANIHDFCSLNSKNENFYRIHEDLESECDKFIVFTTIRHFYLQNAEWLDKPIKEFKDWIDKQNINKETVFNELFKLKTEEIYYAIENFLEKMDPYDRYNDAQIYLYGSYFKIKEIEWQKCNDISIDVVSDYAIVSGTLNLYVITEIYMTDPIYGDDKNLESNFGNPEFILDISFSYTLKKNNIIENFEVYSIQEE